MLTGEDVLFEQVDELHRRLAETEIFPADHAGATRWTAAIASGT